MFTDRGRGTSACDPDATVMNITVILCTFNRSQSLTRALQSVTECVLPETVSWEVLVVDNNSTDETPSIVRHFCEAYPGRIRYFFEPKAGKSNALNSGIQQTNAELIAFMDDDVVVDREWLQNLTVALNNGNWAGAGGRILPSWTSPPPAWLPSEDRYSLAPLAMFDLGTTPRPLEESPFGTNMAFRKSVFEEFGGFRTDLGPRPNSEIRNEDTEFGQRLLNAGERLVYQPSAIVYHEIPEQRLRKRYFLKWWFDKARADVRQFGTSRSTRWRLAGIPLYLFRRLAIWASRWLVTPNPSRRFSHKLKVWGIVGEMQELVASRAQQKGIIES